MDVFVEQTVKKRMDNFDYIKVVLIIAAALLVPLAVMIAMEQLGLGDLANLYSTVIIITCATGAIYLFKSLGRTLEYSVVNGVITIDIFASPRSRKRLAEVDTRTFEEMGVYDPAAFKDRTKVRTLMCAAPEINGDAWYALFPEEAGQTLLVFSPDEHVLNAIRPYLKRQVESDAFGGK